MSKANSSLTSKTLLPAWMTDLLRRNAFNTKERVLCWQQCYALLESGMGIEEVLKIQSNTYKLQNKPTLRDMFEEIHDHAQRGHFQASISRYVSNNEAMLLSALGETKAAPLFKAATRITKIEELIFRELRQNLLEPLLIVFVCFSMIWGAGEYFIPGFTELVPLDQWQGISKLFGSLCIFVNEYVFSVIAGLVIFISTIIALNINYSGPGRNTMDKYPPFSVYKFLTGVSFMFTLLEFLSAGIDINEKMLKRMERSSSPYLRSRIAAIRYYVSRDKSLGRAMILTGNGFPTPELIPILMALEGTDNWVYRLQSFADIWIKRAEDNIKEKTAAMNVVLYGIIALFIAGGILTIFDLLSLIGKG